MGNKKVKSMWWEGNNLIIETVEGEIWAFKDARVVAMKQQLPNYSTTEKKDV